MNPPRSRLVHLALLTGLAANLQAADLFEVTVQSPAASVTSSDSSLLNLLDRAINTEGEFAIFNGAARATTLSYAGVPNALRVTLNASETSALLEIPITGFSRTFSGTDSDDLENQIEDFLKQEGAQELARFYREINARSVAALTDGNPHSSTALLANRAFDLYGTHLGLTREEHDQARDYAGGAHFGLVPDAGLVDAEGYEGFSVSLPLDVRIRLAERVGLFIDLTANFLDLEGSQAFQLALGLGVPVKIFKQDADHRWLWQVTPSGGALVAGSADYLAGGLLYAGTLTSLLGYDFGPFAVALGNQIGFCDTVKLKAGDYEFDSGVEQRILKNGL